MGVGFGGFGISIKGRDKILNQDYFLLRNYKNTLVLVVCDGLGSKRFSNIGSKMLAESIALLLKKTRLSECNLYEFESKLIKLWQEKILCYTQYINECSSTLLMAVIYDRLSFFGRVGDGGIIIFGKKEYYMEEEDKDFANFTSSFGREKIKWLVLETKDIESIAIFSDGITEFLDQNKVMRFFSDFIESYKYSNKKNEIKSWLQSFNARGFRDDKTLIVAYRS